MSFADLLNQTITIEPYAGMTGAGEPAYDAPVDYACRAEDELVSYRNAAGATVYANTRVFLAPDAIVPTQSRTTLSGTIRTVVNVTRSYARDHLHHLEIALE